MSAESYWPQDVGDSSIVTPLSILKEQAAALGPLTKGLVTAEVQPTPSGNSQILAYVFSLVSATVNYRYQMFIISHPISLYPVNATYNSQSQSLTDENTFRGWLKGVLSSQQTKNIVAALIAQAKQ